MCKGSHVQVVPGTDELITKRLRLRPWAVDDADAALAIFGQRQIARWLAPAMPRVADRNQMRLLLAGHQFRDGQLVLEDVRGRTLTQAVGA